MKLLLTRLTKLLLFIIIVHFFVVYISIKLSKNIKITSHIISKDILNEGSKIFIMGNSHPACAINDSFLPKNYINISKGAEPLFYTIIKARKLLNENNKIDTIIIEFTNNSLSTVGWVLDNDRLFSNYQKNFAKMNFDEHYFLFSNNFYKSLKTIFSLTPRKIWSSNKDIDGKYVYLKRRRIISPKVEKQQLTNSNKKKYDYNKTLEYKGFNNLISLIVANPQTHFILTRMPQLPSFIFKNELQYQKCLNQIKCLQNCRYIDFTHTKLDNNCFGDEEHLNHQGAVAFTPIFLDSIGVISSKLKTH